MQLDLAPFYVEYGYALLTNAQQSNDVFGGAVKAAQQAKLGVCLREICHCFVFPFLLIENGRY